MIELSNCQSTGAETKWNTTDIDKYNVLDAYITVKV